MAAMRLHNGWSYGGHLEHFGIKGQQWGIRRFQNEDGTLTEEGKKRYLDQMTDYERKQYFQMSENRRKAVTDKMAEGKKFKSAVREVQEDIKQRNRNISAVIVTGALLYASPITRALFKSVGRTAFRTIANSKIAQRGSQFLARNIKRNMAKKAGAIVLNKKAFNVV